MMQPGQRPAHRFGGDSVYLEPDPVTVARVWRTHGWQAVVERWFYKSHTELKNIRIVGEERLARRSEAE